MLGSDEVHEDVVLHDAGLQARLGDRAPGTPAQQHLTWGAVGRDCISQWSLGPLRTLDLSSPLLGTQGSQVSRKLQGPPEPGILLSPIRCRHFPLTLWEPFPRQHH